MIPLGTLATRAVVFGPVHPLEEAGERIRPVGIGLQPDPQSSTMYTVYGDVDVAAADGD